MSDNEERSEWFEAQPYQVQFEFLAVELRFGSHRLGGISGIIECKIHMDHE